MLEKVTILPPCSFVDFTTHTKYDVIVFLNANTYVSAAEQTQAIENMATYNSVFLVLSAFHPDTIKRDLQSQEYSPITENLQSIHESWDEKVNARIVPAYGTPEYSWIIPPFSEVQAFEYKY